MKYIIYISLLLFQVVRKTIGLVWYYVAVPFRKYSRNAVYNYALSNGVFLKRLLERPITIEASRYIIAPFHDTNGGYIKRRKVSKIEYHLVVWLLWGWIDDDSNDDTFDYGRVQELRRERPIYFDLLKDCQRKQYGNSFDLGDAREPNFHWVASTMWNGRNTAYNFKYLLHTKPLDYKYAFSFEIFGVFFGWKNLGDELRWTFIK